MPKLSKQFHLEVTVEQFLGACSMLELQEVSLLVDSYIQRKENMLPSEKLREYSASEDRSLIEEKILPFSKDFNPIEMKEQRRNDT